MNLLLIIATLVLQLNSFAVSTKINNSQSSDTKNIINHYVNYIMQQHFIKNTLVINYNSEVEIKSKFPVVIHSSKINFHEMHSIQFDMYIIIPYEEKIMELINNLATYSYWKSRANFVLIFDDKYKDNLSDLFMMLWKIHIYNVLLLYYNLKEVQFITFFPFNNGNCGKNLLPEYISKDTTDFFPPKIPNNLNGCEFELESLVRAPYVVSLNFSGKDPSESGIEITILYNIAKKLNFVPKYIYHPHNDWGYRLMNGSYIMMYKDLYAEKISMIVNGFYYNSSIFWDFDYMYLFLNAKGYWWVPAAIEIPVWKNLTKIFNNQLWLIIFLSLVLNGIFRWIVEKNNEGILYCIFSSMCAMILIPIKFPKERALKLQLHVWIASGLIISTIYISQLISILSKPLYEKQIKSLDEAFEHKLKFGFHPLYVHVYNESIAKDKYILKHCVLCSADNECVNRTAFQRDFAIMKNDRQIKHWIPKYWTLPNGRNMIYPILEYVILNLVG